MAVREFAQAEYVTWGIGTGGLDTVLQGAFTTAAIAKRIGAPGEQGALLDIANGAAGSRGFFRYTSGDLLNYLRGQFDSGGDGPEWDAADDWCMVAFTKAAGTAVVRYHLFPLGGSWTHVDSAGTVDADDNVCDRARTVYQDGDDWVFRGRYAVMAVWDSVLADLTLEGLTDAYSDWENASPIALWRFDQDSTTTAIDDQTGNGADQSALVGSTVVTGDDPPGFSFGGATTVAVGQVVETDSAQPIGAAKTQAIGLASEADIAQALVPAKAAGVGQATESDQAQAVASLKAATVGQVSESDSAQQVGTAKTAAFGQAAESNTAQPISVTGEQVVVLGQVVDTSTAQPVAWAPMHRLVGQATEADQAQSVTQPGKSIIAVGQAGETDLGLALATAKVRSILPATETAAALAVTPTATKLIGQATETDLALAFPVSSLTVPVRGEATVSSTTVSVATSSTTASVSTRSTTSEVSVR